jgi:hypothetical protein
MQIDQEYCINDYWCDYPRRDRVKIDECSVLTDSDRRAIRSGKTVTKPDRGGSYIQRFEPIKYNGIR